MPMKPGAPLDQGGAPHQTTKDGYEALTTQQGVPVGDDQNHLKAGTPGPMLMDDFHFREKIFHFDHERIPERVVHARGYAAHGFFELTDSLEEFTRAKVLTETGKKVPLFTRFSTVAGNKGSPDLARDVRGFAVKFYTEEGNWDLVGNNIPVFFIQDAIKFPDLIHSAKAEPDRGFPQAQTAHDNFWDFISLSPVHGRVRRTHISPDQCQGQEHVREVPLEAQDGHAVGRLERGGQDQRRGPRFPPA